MNPMPDLRGLYAITSPELCAGPSLAAGVAGAIRGGASIIQYRDKQASPGERVDRATRLLHICSEAGVRLIINDDAGLASGIGADGVHIGATDGDLARTRERIGPECLLGVSCYDSLQRALEAQEAGADYVAFGSMFPSPTKPNAPCASLDLLQQAQSVLTVPVVAIGGITLDNAARVIAAGADAVAVISALFETSDIETTARKFAHLF